MESSRMVQAARSAGLFLMEAMWSRFLPSYTRLIELIDQGIIGSIVMVEANMGYWYPFDPTTAQFDAQRAGGSLLDLGVYPAQLCSLLLGQPDRIVAAGHVGRSGVDEQVGAVLHHSGGALGVITSSISSTLSCSAHIYGTDGSIKLPIFMHCPQDMTLLRSGQSERIECGNDGNGLQYEAAEVGRCLRAGLTESPIMPLDESNSIMGTLDAIRKQIGLVYPGEMTSDAEIASDQLTRQTGNETKEHR
jgi:predicted dehydrogenase